MPSQLNVYNDALRLVGERQLVSLDENREPRRLLDAIWDGAIEYCLEEGQWNFAIRSQQLDYSPSVEPPFGYRRAFNKPDDWVRTVAVTTDPYFNCPLMQYTDEAGFWFSDQDVMYVRYVSNDLSFGKDTSLWPQSFRHYVASYLALQLAPRLKNDIDEDKLTKAYRYKKADALAKDALQEPAKAVPDGCWVQSRRGRFGRDYSR